MLYDILKNRAAVNILKQLSENEFRKAYTTPASDFRGDEEAISLLSAEKLIYNEDSLLSISEKGKKFIEVFDNLVSVFNEKASEKKPSIAIEYGLSEFEKKIIFLLFRIQRETGEDVPLLFLTQELFPYEDAGRRKLRVSRELSKLEQLNLIKKIKKERNVFAQITESGMKVVKRQIVTEVKKVL